jgi:hypothetical protein
MIIFLLACFFALVLVLVCLVWVLAFCKAAGFGILANVQILWGRLHKAGLETL